MPQKHLLPNDPNKSLKTGDCRKRSQLFSEEVNLTSGNYGALSVLIRVAFGLFKKDVFPKRTQFDAAPARG
jgi:hypothetical protein